MRNGFMSTFCSIHHTAAFPLPSSGNLVFGIFRCFSSSTLLVVAHSSPFISHFHFCCPLKSPHLAQQNILKSRLSSARIDSQLAHSELPRDSGRGPTELSSEARSFFILNPKFWKLLLRDKKNITCHDISFIGFANYPEQDWNGSVLLLMCLSIALLRMVSLKLNVLLKKGKPELAFPWSTMPFYYTPQTQGKMEIMDREWVNLYCWTPMGARYSEFVENGDIGISYMEFCMSFGREM